MKIICKILAFGTIALSVGGCDLTMLPEHELSPEQYFQNESDLTLWSNQFYNDNLESADIGINDADDKIDNGLSDYITGSRNAASQTWSFSALRKINYLLEHLDQCPDRALATKYEAVARFFRAYFYFLKVRTYGDVPYYDHVLGSTDADVYKARDDRGYVMDRVLEDFDFAARNLPGTWESGNTRVTKWAALAYASRAALYEGTFRKYHGMADADKYLRQAAATAKEFITDSPFYLYEEGTEPYRELFYSENAKTCEVVLCRRYDKAFGISHSVPYNIKFGRTSLTRRFMNHYLMADGSRFTDKEGWETMPYSEETQGRDPRMAQTVLCPGYKQVEATTVTRNTLSSHTGYEPIKFVGTAANSTTSGAASSDWILMRARRSLPQLRRGSGRIGNDHAERPRNLGQPDPQTREDDRHRSHEGRRFARSLPARMLSQRDEERPHGRHPRNPPRAHRRTGHGAPLPFVGPLPLERVQAGAQPLPALLRLLHRRCGNLRHG